LAVRPFFTSVGSDQMWRHCGWIADFFAACAAERGDIEAEEAFLLGMLHDVGFLAPQLRGQTQTRLARLEAGGFALRSAEWLLLGTDHGELGAKLLSHWGFPDHLTEAVQFHHRPAECDSLLAAGLYAAGFLADDEEDAPSHRHLHTSLQRLRLAVAELSKVRPSGTTISSVVAAA
jgi:HD-like signal output (HDOD) protein